MPKVDAATAAARWVQGAQSGATRYVEGARATSKDPTALAIQAIPRMRQRINEAIDSGKVANGLRRAGKQGWLQGIESKGQTNYSSGVSASEQKVASAFASLFSYMSGLESQLASMPNVTDADRDNRALFWIRNMRQYQRPG